MEVNPLFVNEGTLDFDLQSGSPAINKGQVIAGIAYNGSAPDIGEYEYSGGLPGDTTPFTVTLTAPPVGANVAGTVTVKASASDNVGVVGVQVKLDGRNLGAEVATAPYAVAWVTTTGLDGAHTLTAVARDAAGNVGTAAGVSVTVLNSDTTPPTVSIAAPASGAIISGMITVSASASDNVGVAGVQFKLDGANLGAEVTVAPYTVAWDTTTVVDGPHILTAIARDAAGNPAGSDPVAISVSNAVPGLRSPYKGTPFVVPGLIEAEDFDNGGEGVAYHDRTAGNQGGAYRTDVDVDIISPYPNGYVINSFQTGEWLEYSINVLQSGTYRLEALVSSKFQTSRWHIEIDGVNVTGSILVPNTGSWGTFQWVGTSGVALTAGQHILRVYAEQQYFNLDAIRTVAEVIP